MALCTLCLEEGRGEIEAQDIYLITFMDGSQKAGSVCPAHAHRLGTGFPPYQGRALLWGVDEKRLDMVLRTSGH